MKVENIRIGDYFLVYPDMIPIKVAAVHKRKVGYHTVNNKLTWVRISLLRPFPISKEILEKFGFKYERIDTFNVDSWELTEPNSYIVMTRDDETPEEYTTLDLPYPIKYVHELQLLLSLYRIHKNIEL